MMQRTEGSVYRCFDASGELLYIGSTWRLPAQRLREHRTGKPWWDEVAEVRVERHPLETLRAVETQAIQQERPRYNIVDHPDFTPEPQVPLCPFHCMAEIRLNSGRIVGCGEWRGHEGAHLYEPPRADPIAWTDDDPGAEPDDLEIEFTGVPYRPPRARSGT
jgi:hypothetical protein